MDFLIIGGDSLLGTGIIKALKSKGLTYEATTRKLKNTSAKVYLDLAEPIESWPQLPDAEIWVVCAAISKLSDCSDNPKLSEFVNVTAVSNLAKLCNKNGNKLIFISTNQVFDGVFGHIPKTTLLNPINTYGRQKQQAEQQIEKPGGDYVILRISKIWESLIPRFKLWHSFLKESRQVSVPMDLRVAPIKLEDFVNAIINLSMGRYQGVYQLSGPVDISYADLAFLYASLGGFDPQLVLPFPGATLGIPLEQVSQYTTLATSTVLRNFMKNPFDLMVEFFDSYNNSEKALE
jgi:dTDP-4-dehydrorhamnose reductase